MSPFSSGRLPMASPFRPLLRFFFLRAAGGDEQIRPVAPLLARQVLSQLSYTPVFSGPLLLRRKIPLPFAGMLFPTY